MAAPERSAPFNFQFSTFNFQCLPILASRPTPLDRLLPFPDLLLDFAGDLLAFGGEVVRGVRRAVGGAVAVFAFDLLLFPAGDVPLRAVRCGRADRGRGLRS